VPGDQRHQLPAAEHARRPGESGQRIRQARDNLRITRGHATSRHSQQAAGAVAVSTWRRCEYLVRDERRGIRLLPERDGQALIPGTGGSLHAVSPHGRRHLCVTAAPRIPGPQRLVTPGPEVTAGVLPPRFDVRDSAAAADH